MGGFREHGVMLYLDKTLYKAFIRLQADKGLGRSYAGLLPLTHGLFDLGYLSKEDYEEHVAKYSQGLNEKPGSEPKEQPKCDFCGKGPVVTVFREKVAGIEKRCCAFHAKSISVHPKWEEVS